MADNVTFQTTVTATPPNATSVATDEIGGAHYQRIKLAFGDDGTAYALSYGTPLPIGTLPGGTFSVNGTLQALGSVSIVGTLAGGSVGIVGTLQVLGTYQPLAGSVHLASRLPGTVDVGTIAGTVSALGTLQPLAGSVHVANVLSGTFQTHGTVPIGTVAGTVSALGTFQPLAGSVHLASFLPGGSVAAQGYAAHDAAAAGAPLLMGAFGSSGTQAAVSDGDAVRLWADPNGRLQIRGTIDSMPAITVEQGTVPGGTIQLHGTSQVLGTVRALTEVTTNVTIGTIAEGTIQSFTGTAQVLGTVRALAEIQMGTIPGGTIQLHGTVPVGTIAGTVSVLGTVQPLAGSAHLATNLAGGTVVSVGSAAHGAAADARPHLVGAFGSSGTQAAVADGQAVRLWADLNGRLQVRGTIDSLPAVSGTVQPLAGSVHVANTVSGTVQVHGTVPVGTVAGTVSVLGTVQGLAGSVHLATNLAGGTVVSVGSAAHGAAADGRPHLMAAFGSSGTQAAVDDGDAVRLWADLNGRLIVRGTIDSIGTISALGTVQPLAGSVHVAALPSVTIAAGTVSLQAGGTLHVGSVQRVAGTVDLGTVAGTVSVLGSVSIAGTVSIGTVQRLAGGTVDYLAGTVRGTVVAQAGGFGSYFATAFTAAVSFGTLIAPPGQGTRWRLFDVTLNTSANGTALLTEAATGAAGTSVFGPLFFAGSGGWQFNSSRGLLARGTNQGLYFSNSAGTMPVTVNYALES